MQHTILSLSKISKIESKILSFLTISSPSKKEFTLLNSKSLFFQ